MKFRYLLLFVTLVLATSSCVEKTTTPNKPNKAKNSKVAAKKAKTKPSNSKLTTWNHSKIIKINDTVLKNASNIKAKSNERIVISGWAIDKNNNGAPENVQIKIGQKSFNAKLGQKSNYLVRTFDNDKLENAGFIISIPANQIPTGKHIVNVIAKHKNGQSTKSDQKLVLIVS